MLLAICSGCKERTEFEFPVAPRFGGFTLTELIVVIAVLAILAASIAPQFVSSYQATLLRSASRELIAAVRLARSQAVTLGVATRLVLDPDERAFWIEQRSGANAARGAEVSTELFRRARDVPGSSGTLRGELRISMARYETEATGEDEERAPRRGARSGPRPSEPSAIAFRPDGTCERWEIILRDREGFGFALRMAPTTARVEVRRLDPLAVPVSPTNEELRR